MATTSLLQTKYSGRFADWYSKTTVWGNIVSTNYEGDAANSAVVRINSLGNIDVTNYTGSFDFQTISATSQDLPIDQKKTFNFVVDETVQLQSNNNIIDEAAKKAAVATAIDVDTYIAKIASSGSLYSTSSLQITSSAQAYDFLVDTAVRLSEADVPKVDRFIVVPEFIGGMLAKDSRWTLVPGVMQNGVQGTVAGMDVYFSNNMITSGSDYYTVAGVRNALAYVGQLSKVKEINPENQFSNGLAGLFVYGAKIINTDGIMVQKIKK